MRKREGWLAPCEVGKRAETGLGQEGTSRFPGVGEGETRSPNWPGAGFGTRDAGAAVGRSWFSLQSRRWDYLPRGREV